jgi:hypothetical protein
VIIDGDVQELGADALDSSRRSPVTRCEGRFMRQALDIQMQQVARSRVS